MSSEPQVVAVTLDQSVQGTEHLGQPIEQAVPPWQYLVARAHPWRKQLSIKGRNMTVGQMLGTMRANQLSPKQASADFELPLEAIQEALAYQQANRSLLEQENSEERRHLIERGYALEPRDLPR